MYRRHQSDDGGDGFMLGLLQIALGVFIGSLAAVFAYEEITAWRIEQRARKVAEQIKKADQALAQQQAAQAVRRAEEAERARQEAEANRSALALANRLQRERHQRREAAWNAYYTPSPDCKLDSATMKCANEYMAARKRFDGQYKD